ncbi:hypothetical protein P7C70_g4280, partial [Phenoliferia sp. Uapishka_3]
MLHSLPTPLAVLIVAFTCALAAPIPQLPVSAPAQTPVLVSVSSPPIAIVASSALVSLALSSTPTPSPSPSFAATLLPHITPSRPIPIIISSTTIPSIATQTLTVTSTSLLMDSGPTVTATISVPASASATLPPPSPSSWSLNADFGRDLPSELGVKTWEWGKSNVVTLAGVPATAWATPTSTSSAPSSSPTAQSLVQTPQVDLANATVMQVYYPNGSINPANNNAPIGGTGMYLTPLNLAEAKNVTLEYSVFFPTDFDFVKGGKLPGMYGGHTGCSGGHQSEDCFSTRLMFRAGGLGEMYLYAPKSSQPPALCQTLPHSYCAGPYGLSIGRGAWTFKTGEWTHVRQDVVLNTPGVADGSFQVFINDALMLKVDAVVYRKAPPPPPSSAAHPSSTTSAPSPASSTSEDDSDSSDPSDDGLLGGLLGGILKRDLPVGVGSRDNVALSDKDNKVSFIGVAFDSFFGGNSPDYASPKDQYTYFNRLSMVINE